MRRGITRVGVWLAVTAAAVALSWFAVRTVLRDTVFETPRAPALAAPEVEGHAPGLGGPSGGATMSPTSFPPPPPSSNPATAAASSKPAAPASTPGSPASSKPTDVPAPTSGPAADPGSTRSFEVRGGRASFTFHADSASFIAASPNSGWAVKLWPGDRWLRVDFTRGDRTSSVFVTWNDHPPLADTYEQ